MSAELAELHRFNAWANRSLISTLRQLPPEQLATRREGMYNSILGVLNHLALVESVYLQMMRHDAVERPGELDLDGLAALLDGTGAGLAGVAATGDPGATFHIPWFERDFTVFQGLSQVLTHSTNHRADVNLALFQLGVESADVDYIDLALEEG